MHISKLKQTLRKQMLVAMVAVLPLLFIAGEALAANPLEIRNAVLASQVDCIEGDTAISQNSNLCVHYGKITNVGMMAATYTLTFQPYNELGQPVGPTVPIYVGKDIVWGLATYGSGQWVVDNAAYVNIMLTDSLHKMGSIVLKKQFADGNFYLQASSAKPGLFPWGDSDAALYTSPVDTDPEILTEAVVWRAHTTRVGELREVSVDHLMNNGDHFKDINGSSTTISTAERIRLVKHYVMGTGFVTRYQAENVATGSKGTPTSTVPTDYVSAADQSIALPLNAQTTCTYSNPCNASAGVIVLRLNNGQKYHVGSKKFTKSQLDGIFDVENAKLPCPFAAYALDNGGLQLLKRAIQYNWKFKFDYVVGTAVYTQEPGTYKYLLGDFSGRNWLIGRPISRITEFYGANGAPINMTLSDDDKIFALFGGHVEYDIVNCACIEIYF